MDDAENSFSALRPRLRRIAFRILGSETQAETVVDAVAARFRSQRCDLDATLDSTAWLVSTTSSLSLERWRAAATRPEIDSDSPSARPNRIAALTQNILTETHAALEQLAPDSRLAFLLHDIFDADLAELAMTLGKRRGDCQSLIEHARRELRQYHQRHAS